MADVDVLTIQKENVGTLDVRFCIFKISNKKCCS